MGEDGPTGRAGALTGAQQDPKLAIATPAPRALDRQGPNTMPVCQTAECRLSALLVTRLSKVDDCDDMLRTRRRLSQRALGAPHYWVPFLGKFGMGRVCTHVEHAVRPPSVPRRASRGVGNQEWGIARAHAQWLICVLAHITPTSLTAYMLPPHHFCDHSYACAH